MGGVSIRWEQTDHGLRPVMSDGRKVAWCAQPGFQMAYVRLPPEHKGGPFEVLLGGNRGGGKSAVMLADFGQHVGKRYGGRWKGILFRREFDQLGNVIEESKRLYGACFPEAKYNGADHSWTWPDGEMLLFRQMKTEADYWNKRHGHEYARVMWDDLTTWPSPTLYQLMISTIRTTDKSMPVGVRATSNPDGPGHSWVKRRFNLPGSYGRLVISAVDPVTGLREPSRMAIKAQLADNKALLAGTPDYLNRILAAATSEAQRKAWAEGDWNIVSGGMFEGAWAPEWICLPSFPFDLIPLGWRIDRSYDDGFSAPWSCGVWAESNGEPLVWTPPGSRMTRTIGPVAGDLIRVGEVYGWNGKPNEGDRKTSSEIALAIRSYLDEGGIMRRCQPGPADTAIYNASPLDPAKTIASEMAKYGLQWTRADKGQGSRVAGIKLLYERLKNAVPAQDTGRREKPGIFACERAEHFIRTVPLAPRAKPPKNPDDIDPAFEDHVIDETRYRLRAPNRQATFRPGGRLPGR